MTLQSIWRYINHALSALRASDVRHSGPNIIIVDELLQIKTLASITPLNIGWLPGGDCQRDQ